MLVNVLSVLALSALTFASPARRAPLLEIAPSGGVGARDYKDYKDKDYDHKDKDKWDDKDCVKGYLKLTTYDGKDFGYVGKDTTWYGAYTKANHDEEKLLVEINESFDTWGYFNIKTLNGLDPWKPYFSGIVGFASTSDDIGKGSYNYFYLGGAKWPTPPGASAQPVENSFTFKTGISRNVETAIFHAFDKKTKCFDVQWVNCDYSCPETFIGVYEEDKSCLLFGTGDKEVFTATFGKATFVKLSFEEKYDDDKDKHDKKYKRHDEKEKDDREKCDDEKDKYDDKEEYDGKDKYDGKYKRHNDKEKCDDEKEKDKYDGKDKRHDDQKDEKEKCDDEKEKEKYDGKDKYDGKYKRHDDKEKDDKEKCDDEKDKYDGKDKHDGKYY